MLRVENITKTYLTGTVETPVLQGVNFEVNGGELVAIMVF